MRRLGLLERSNRWRDRTVSAERVALVAAEDGLACISQELITWQMRRQPIDCLSVIVWGDGPHARERLVLENRAFSEQGPSLSRLAPLYS